MDKAGVYRITVRGTLPESFLDRVGGMQIVKGTSSTPLLEGLLPDQAALMTLMSTLTIRLLSSKINKEI